MRGKEVPSSKKPISKGLKALIDRKHSVHLHSLQTASQSPTMQN